MLADEENSLQVVWCDYFFLCYLIFTKNVISTEVLGILPCAG